ncbi:MAG: UDP-4-amino-4,6-dideoxy-N-acetyl-beta-L-altrosamine transaminase [Candidatus Omnitrophica bacterium]|nr:UDP-4-amino-4,6-dideoxy-N-acetyl-beta-L-altrosamine transaminase [Candidatus Omnitrophota bacterium]
MGKETNKKRMLITGASGLLGSNLAWFFKDSFDVVGVCFCHPVVLDGVQVVRGDLCVPEVTERIITQYQPDIVVHCAAQANVDACEENPALAYRQNVAMTRIIRDALTGRKTKLIFISTDLVYGPSDVLHREDEAPAPCNEYGRTKVQAEAIVRERPGSLVLRTNFFGWSVGGRKSLGEWVIESLSQNRRIQGFRDVFFSSIYTLDLAAILQQCLLRDAAGVFNLGSATPLSKYDFLKRVAQALKLDTSLIEEISVDRFFLQAPRNKNVRLDVSKLSGLLGCAFPTAEVSIERFAAHYRQGMFRAICHAPACYPRLDYVPYGRQWIDDEDIHAVVQALKSSNLTQGPGIVEFEGALCRYAGTSHGAAFNSGTSALHAACLAAGIGKGDEVITSPNTFVASANCVVYCGGIPVFADIDPRTYNISPTEVEKKITERTRGIIPVHFAGQSCDMQALQAVVRRKEKEFGHKIYIIEDASHALGSYYQQGPVGDCRFSDMVVFSFHPVKQITTAEGGILLSNDKQLHRAACYARSHGIAGQVEELDPKECFEEVPGKGLLRKPWYYEQQELGYNYRITDLQCALGLSQLRKLAMFKARRREIWNAYNVVFSGQPLLTVPYEGTEAESNFHLYVLQIDFKALGKTRTEVMLALRERGIMTQVHYIPVYTHPFYRREFGGSRGHCLQAESYYAKCLSLPLFPAMRDEEVSKVIDSLREVLQ